MCHVCVWVHLLASGSYCFIHKTFFNIQSPKLPESHPRILWKLISAYISPWRQTYVHRVGRTARAGREGVAYTLLQSYEVKPFKALLRYLLLTDVLCMYKCMHFCVCIYPCMYVCVFVSMYASRSGKCECWLKTLLQNHEPRSSQNSLIYVCMYVCIINV
jgi:hypothetical protein